MAGYMQNVGAGGTVNAPCHPVRAVQSPPLGGAEGKEKRRSMNRFRRADSADHLCYRPVAATHSTDPNDRVTVNSVCATNYGSWREQALFTA